MKIHLKFFDFLCPKVLFIIDWRFLLMPDSSKESNHEFCGTTDAAKILGISVTTVQFLAEKKELLAWRTKGGHRRISLQSIYDYQRRLNLAPSLLLEENYRLRVFVIDKDSATRLILQTNFDNWDLPLEAMMYASTIEALIDMASIQPAVLFVDLCMFGSDGFEFLRILKAHRLFKNLTIVVMSGVSQYEVRDKSDLPDGVKFLEKPIDLVWLRGFLDALISVRQIKRRSNINDV
jgi:excisionase family DNA binding protein